MTRPPQLSAAFRVAEIIARPPLQLFTRQDWRGAEHLPREGGFIVCSNHISNVDPLTLAHFLFDNGHAPRFLAKESLFRLPVLGRLVSGTGQIPVLRESTDAGRAYAAAVAAVQAGACVVVYPEATLTRDPDLWPMVGKTGAARIALATGCPVIPVAQWGPHEILPRYGRRPRLVPPRTVRLTAGPPVDLGAHATSSTPDAARLRAATDSVLDAVTGLLAELRGETPPARRWDPRAHGQPVTGRIREGDLRAEGETT